MLTSEVVHTAEVGAKASETEACQTAADWLNLESAEVKFPAASCCPSPTCDSSTNMFVRDAISIAPPNELDQDMASLTDQYADGDCQVVRDALSESLHDNSTSEEFAIATAVADEFVNRSIANLSYAYDALLAVGYEFSDPANAFVLNETPDDVAVAEFEEKMGEIPLIASRWHRKIKSVNFSQTLRQMTDRQSPLSGLGWNVPFIVQSFEKALEHWNEHRRQCEEDDQYRRDAGELAQGSPTPALFTGGCASNNDCKGFKLPSFRFDDVLFNDGGGDRLFGDEIALGFARRVFPILTASERTRKTIGSLYGEPDIEYLSTKLPRDFRNV